MRVDLRRADDGALLTDVPSQRLAAVHPFVPGHFVIGGGWVGRISSILHDVRSACPPYDMLGFPKKESALHMSRAADGSFSGLTQADGAKLSTDVSRCSYAYGRISTCHLGERNKSAMRAQPSGKLIAAGHSQAVAWKHAPRLGLRILFCYSCSTANTR